MTLKTQFLAAAAAVVILAGLALAGCKGYSAPTTPYGGGSSGGNAAFDSGELRAPATFVHSFATAGTVGYHCQFHRSMGMVGTVTVANGAADSAVVTASGTTFAPAAVSVRPGGFVRWNVVNDHHTITSN
jgi:plastocyanin